MAKFYPYVAPRPPKPCDCHDGYCAMQRAPKSLMAERALKRMIDRAEDEKLTLVCRKRNT